jgi:photosystem II stability/assembly factor-like uncharacterized protein
MCEPRRIDAPAAPDGHRSRSRLVSVAIILAVTLVALLARPATLPAQEHGANVAPVPPPGGLALIVSGTDDIAALIAAQKFEVAAVWMFDVATQRHLVFIPGGPAIASTLKQLNATDVVALKAADAASPSPVPAPAPAVAAPALDDPCGNALGDGDVIISGPSAPWPNDDDRVFRSLTVHPMDPNTVLMGTERNGFVLSTGGGVTWTRQRFGLRSFGGDGYAEIWDIAYAPSDPNIVFAATLDSPGPIVGDAPTTHAGIYKSTDGGRTWARKNCGLVSSRIVAIRVDPSDPNVVIAGVEGGFPSYLQGDDRPYFDGGMFRSTDGGEQWTRIEIDANDRFSSWLIEVVATNPTTFVAVGYDGEDPSRSLGLLRSVDGGLTWQPYAGDSSLPANVGSFAVSADGEAIYVTADATYRHWVSTDSGTAWAPTEINQSNGPVAVSPMDANHVVFVSLTQIYRSLDGLKTRSAAVITHGSGGVAEMSFRDIAFAPSDPNVVYAAKDHYLLYRSTDGGASFTFIADIRNDVLNAVP